MKTASMVLGIVGGVMAIVIAIFLIVAGSVMVSIDDDIDLDMRIEKSGFVFDRHGFFFSEDTAGITQFVFNRIGGREI